MILTYYEYLNEGKGISNFIKKLSENITGEIFKKYENLSDELQSFSFDISTNFSEIELIKNISISIESIHGNYRSEFSLKDKKNLLSLCLKFDLPIKSKLDHHYLHELVIHELTHLYEYYNIVKNRREFPLYDKIKKSLIKTIKQDEFDIFSYFRNLVYLTLDNELNARVAQSYQLLKFKKVKDKDQLLNMLKTTHIWKKYKEIENFNPKKYTSDLTEILGVSLSCILINEFNEELVRNKLNFSFILNVKDKLDIEKYFRSWNKRFKYKLKKHLIKLNKIVDEVIKDI